MRSFVKVLIAVMLAGAMAGGWTAMSDSAPQKSHKHMEATDPFLWLEDVHGEKALDWVKTKNTKSLDVLQRDPEYKSDYDSILKVMDATDRIPYGTIDHQFVFNFWQDAD